MGGFGPGPGRKVETQGSSTTCMFGEESRYATVHGSKQQFLIYAAYSRVSLAATVHLLIDSHRTESY